MNPTPRFLWACLLGGMMSLPVAAGQPGLQPYTRWSTTIPTGDTFIDIPPLLGMDTAGNSYLCGSVSSAHGGSDFTVIKLNQQGRLVWTAQAEGAPESADRLLFRHVDKLGNIYLGGDSLTHEWNLALLKLNAQGELQWRDLRASHASSLSVNRSGEVAMGGYLRDEGGFDHPLVAKWNARGELMWESIGPSDIRGVYPTVLIDDDGQVYATGRDFLTSKLGADGTVLWTRQPIPSTYGTRIALAPSGQVVVSGTGPRKVLTFAVDARDGSMNWMSSFDTEASPVTADIQFDSGGNCYVVASVYQGEHQLLIKHDSAGNLLWADTTMVGQEAGPLSLAIGRDDCLYTTAATAGDGVPSDVITRKLNPQGALIWSITYDGPGTLNDLSAGLGLDARGDVHVGVASYHRLLPNSGVVTVLEYSQR